MSPSFQPSLAPVAPPTLAPAPLPDTSAAWARRAAICAVALALVGGASVGTRARDASHVALGDASFRTVESGARERWGDEPITVVLDPSLDDAGNGAADAVEAAFGTWLSSDNGLPNVTFNHSSESGGAVHDGVNRIVFAPITIAGHENDVAVTVGYADSTTGTIAEADMILNSRYVFGNAHGDDDDDTGDESHPAHCESKKYDVQSIATHEAGHFFGLGEDMSDTKATMFIRSAPCETHKRALTRSDENPMKTLYAEPSGSAAPAAPPAPVDPNAPIVGRGACAVGRVGAVGDPPFALAALGLVVAMAAAGCRRRGIVRTST